MLKLRRITSSDIPGYRETSDVLNRIIDAINNLAEAQQPSDATVGVLDSIVDNLNALESQVEKIKEEMTSAKRGKK